MQKSKSVLMNVAFTALFACAAACTSSGSDGGGGGGGDDDGSGQLDAATPAIDAPKSSDSGLDTTCGHPGDPGNELGVGKYCSGIIDCLGLSAGICATIGDPNAHFCTKTCTQGSTTACGTGAQCACQGGQCGCLPTSCAQ